MVGRGLGFATAGCFDVHCERGETLSMEIAISLGCEGKSRYVGPGDGEVKFVKMGETIRYVSVIH